MASMHEIQDWLDKYFSKQCVLSFSRTDDIGKRAYTLGKKRGNKSYNYFIHKRFTEIEKNLQNIVRINDKESNTLLLTLTYPKKDDMTSWESYKKDHKLFLDRLRKNKYILANYGKFQYLTVVESTLCGECHAHISLTFERPVKYIKRKRKSRNGKESDYGYILDNLLRDSIRNCWNHISDVCACYSTGGAVNYLTKYFYKQFSLMELLIQKDPEKLTEEERKAIYAFFYITVSKLRTFRASKLVSRRGTPDDEKSLVDLLNNCEDSPASLWKFEGFQDYNTFCKIVKTLWGHDFSCINGMTVDFNGEICDFSTGELSPAVTLESVNYNEFYTLQKLQLKKGA